MTEYDIFVADYVHFTETVEGHPRPLAVSQSVVFSSNVSFFVTTNPLLPNVKDNLSFTQSVVSHLHKRTVNDDLSLVQNIKYGFIKHLSVSDLLSFGERFAKGPALQTVNQGLYFFEYPQRPITQELTFVETIDVHYGYGSTDILVLRETIGLKKTKKQPVTQTLSLNQSVTGYVPKVCPTPGIIPVVPRGYILLFGDVHHQIQLRSPNFNNSNKFTDTRISRNSRGNDLIVYRDPRWPKTESFSYKIQLLKQADVDHLLTFINNSLGLAFALFDWQGFTWNVILTNPQTPINQKTRGIWETQLDFEVVDNASINLISG